MKITNDPLERIYPYAQRRTFFGGDREAVVWMGRAWVPGAVWKLYWASASETLYVYVLREFHPHPVNGTGLYPMAGEASDWEWVTTHDMGPHDIDKDIADMLRDKFMTVSMSTPTGS